MNMVWTDSQIDDLFDLFLPCADQDDADKRLLWYLKNAGKAASKATLVEAMQCISRRCFRRTDYKGPANIVARTSRAGKPITWAEEQVLQWGWMKHSERKKDPTWAYIANILQRPVDEAKEMMNTKLGVKGFAL